ncbi:NAD-dependent epimerase/dehydratase family protein [Pararhodospirillum photometricum]|nr:NAD-dependent epimerase/dehydratase family protein [Pararhodospirillum photometricum]
MRTILVTGAAGCLGRHVSTHLASLPESQVRAGTRVDGRPAPTGEGLSAVVADVKDARTLEAACTGVDAIVHCAAGDRQVLVNGTQAVLNAARSKGVRRVIHLSCSTVYGSAKGAVSEETPLVTGLGDEVGAAVLKAEAEALCRAAAAEGLSVVILRPTVVMGPGSPFWAGTLAQRLANRVWGTIGKVGNGTCSPIDPRDVATAVAAALDADVAPGTAFNLAGPDTLSWNAFFAKYNDALALPDVREIQPESLGVRVLQAGPAKLISRHLPTLKSKKVENTLLSAPDFGELDLYRLVATYPTDKAQRALGWTAVHGVKDAVESAAAWAKAEGLTRRTF